MRLPAWSERLARRLHARCRACGRALAGPPGRDQDPGPCPGLCRTCARDLAAHGPGVCPACGLMFQAPSAGPHVCAACLARPPAWTALAFHGPHEGLLREMILAFKFKAALGLSGLLQDLLAAAWQARAWPLPDLVVPVPLHPARLAWRGFNQSLELARPLARQLARPLAAGALERIRNTPPQSVLPGPERAANVRGAFRADAQAVGGRVVLLVDDVMTTGGTLGECCRVLRRAKAGDVRVLVLSRACQE